MRDQGNFWSNITADINSLSDFLKGTWELSKQFQYEAQRGFQDPFSLWKRLGNAGDTSLFAYNETEILLLCLQVTGSHIKKL